MQCGRWRSLAAALRFGAIVLAFSIADRAQADLIQVPGDYTLIQTALSVAQPGDTVQVACGTYYEYGLEMPSGVVLRSASGEPDCAVIDAQGLGRVLACHGVNAATRIEGLTLAGGFVADGYADAGGLWIDDGSLLQLVDCRITRNSIEGYTWCANGVGVLNASPSFLRCAIADNGESAEGPVGGIACWNSAVTLIECEIAGNQSFQGLAAGLYCGIASQVTAQNCRIADNHATYNGGVMVENATLHLVSCTVEGNSAVYTGGNLIAREAEVTLTNCLVTGGDDTDYGAGMYFESSTATITGSTITANHQSDSEGPLPGGGLRSIGSTVSLVRSVLRGNCADAGYGHEAYINGGSVTFECCVVDSAEVVGAVSYVGLNYTWQSPLFCAPAACGEGGGDYRVDATSICLPENNPCGELIGALSAGCSYSGVSDFAARAHRDRIDLSWAFPQDPTMLAVEIRYRVGGGFPETPASGIQLGLFAPSTTEAVLPALEGAPGTYFFSAFSTDLGNPAIYGPVGHAEATVPTAHALQPPVGGGSPSWLLSYPSGMAGQVAAGAYRLGGDVDDWRPVSLGFDADWQAFTGAFPAADYTARGVEYWLGAPLNCGSVEQPIRQATHLQVSGPTLQARKFRLVASPLLPEADGDWLADLRAAFGGAPGDALWKMATWDSVRAGTAGYWSTASADFLPFAAGRAYWLIHANGGSWGLTGQSPFPASGADYFEITLRDGWNMVGNPAGYAVSMDRAALLLDNGMALRSFAQASAPALHWVDPNLYVYEPDDWELCGGLQNYCFNPEYLHPWEGCWIRNTSGGSLQLRIPAQATPAGKTARRVAAASHPWRLRLWAEGDAGVGAVDLICAKEGQAGADGLDLLAAPSVPDQELTFAVVPEGAATRPLLWREARPLGEAQQVWQLRVDSPHPVRLRWELEEGEASPGYRTLTLEAMDGQAEWPLQALQTLSLPAGRQGLRLVASEGTAGQPVVDQRLWGRSWPNPSAGPTTLLFNLPVGGDVELAVYDVQGRRVWGEAARQLPAGEHALLWPGVDAAGARLPSGVYFVRLSAPGGAATGHSEWKVSIRR